MFKERNNQFSVECQTKQANNCIQFGEYCDSEEEAIDWVEDECWINSGEGWICIRCHEYFMSNLYKIRVEKGVKKEEAKTKKKDDEDGTELFKGIETVL